MRNCWHRVSLFGVVHICHPREAQRVVDGCAYIAIAIDYPDVCWATMRARAHHTDNTRQFGHAPDKSTDVPNDTNGIRAEDHATRPRTMYIIGIAISSVQLTWIFVCQMLLGRKNF